MLKKLLLLSVGAALTLTAQADLSELKGEFRNGQLFLQWKEANLAKDTRLSVWSSDKPITAKNISKAVKIADISKTYNCGLARAVRQKLKKLGITKGLKTVFSEEAVPPHAVKAYTDENGFNHSMTGTVSYMVAIFGCVLASEAIKYLTSEYKKSKKEKISCNSK